MSEQVYAVQLSEPHGQIAFEHPFRTILESRDLAVEIEEKWSVGTLRHGSDDDSSYVLAVVSHLTESQDKVDLVDADRVETLICPCHGYWHHNYDHDLGAKTGDCRHCKEVKRKRRTELPDQQQTLVSD